LWDNRKSDSIPSGAHAPRYPTEPSGWKHWKKIDGPRFVDEGVEMTAGRDSTEHFRFRSPDKGRPGVIHASMVRFSAGTEG